MGTKGTIEVNDIGPVKNVSIPIPDEGGIVVLKGRNGRGKTSALEAIDAALTGRGKLEVRDGALHGKVSAFGVTITVGRSTRRTGELEVESLEGKFSISELIDPGLKSPEAADARRIKALIGLTGTPADAALFYPLVGGEAQFDSLVSASAAKAEDLIAMAEKIKRDLEAKAREAEDAAEKAEGKAVGLRAASTAVEPGTEIDATKLQAALEQAVAEESRLKAAREQERKTADYRARTTAELEKFRAIQSDSVETLEARCAAARLALSQAEERVTELAEQFRAAQSARTAAQHALEAAALAETDAKARQAAVAKLEAALSDTTCAEPVSDKQLQDASNAVFAARQAIERGAVARHAIDQLRDAETAIKTASAYRVRAKSIREAARGTDQVLSEVVAKLGTTLRVEAGRLVLDTHRGATYFHDLSAGEAAKIAIDIGLDAIGEKGVLTLSQEIFEGLDDIARADLAAHAKKRGVVVLTAEASIDETIVSETL